MRVIRIPHSLLDFHRASSFYTQVPVVLLMSDILKGDVNCPALLRFSKVVSLFHEFGHMVSSKCFFSPKVRLVEFLFVISSSCVV